MVKKMTLEQKAEALLIISKLLKNGFSLSQSMNCLRLLDNRSEVFEKIHLDLQNGQMISQSLQHLQLPSVVFNQLVIAQQHGRIEMALEQTGLLLKSQAKQKNKFKELLAYPCFILIFLLTMLIGMKIYIVPQLEIASGGKNIDLFLQLFLFSIGLMALTIVFLVVRIKQKSDYQRALILVKIPTIGKIYLCFYQFLILQGLGMQLASGMNFLDICEANNHLQKDSIQAHLAQKFVTGLTAGKDLLKMIDEEKLLPSQLKIILQAGESGPQLAQDLLLMSELKFEETRRHLTRVLNLVQPFLFGVIAIVIIVTYLLVLLPIYGMMKGMS